MVIRSPSYREIIFPHQKDAERFRIKNQGIIRRVKNQGWGVSYITLARNPGLSMKPAVKNRLNKKIYEATKGYHEKIPLGAVFGILYNEDIIPLQEDYTEWRGMLIGEVGEMHLELSPKNSGRYRVWNGEIIKSILFYTPYKNVMLNLSWYKMPSGRYEVTSYIG
jgi:hypothetical protein